MESFLLLAQRTQQRGLHKQPVLTLHFHGGRKTQKHLSTTTFVSSLLTTENHLHLPDAKWHKRNKRETIIYEDSRPYSHLSRCIFLEENLLVGGAKSVWGLSGIEQLGEL